jgi:hypothetical protein
VQAGNGSGGPTGAAFALALFLMMWIAASSYRGFGRWWQAHTPTIFN